MSSIQEVLKSIELEIYHHETPTTYEMIGAQIVFKNLTEQDFVEMNYDLDMGWDIVSKIKNREEDAVVGPYIIKEYLSMYDDMFELINMINTEKDITSRRFVLQFPKLHCFQNMQFLFRRNELIVIVTMRSCDFKNNFMTDFFLSYYMAQTIANRSRFFDTLFPAPPKIGIMMNIGSLHIYKNSEEIN